MPSLYLLATYITNGLDGARTRYLLLDRQANLPLLPLNHNQIAQAGVEPASLGYEPSKLPLLYRAMTYAGIEPSEYRLERTAS